jgi:hypothetical protein
VKNLFLIIFIGLILTSCGTGQDVLEKTELEKEYNKGIFPTKLKQESDVRYGEFYIGSDGEKTMIKSGFNGSATIILSPTIIHLKTKFSSNSKLNTTKVLRPNIISLDSVKLRIEGIEEPSKKNVSIEILTNQRANHITRISDNGEERSYRGESVGVIDGLTKEIWDELWDKGRYVFKQ